jgi:two-component system sensor histidine kinase ResE
MTITGLVVVVLFILSLFLLDYIDINFKNSYAVKQLFIYTGIIGFLMTTFFAFFLSTRITKPLRNLIKAADLIMQGNYQARVPIVSSDEIGQLGRTFNQMAYQLDATIKDLNREKEQLSSILRSMADAVIAFNADGQVVLLNPPGQQILKRWNGDVGWQWHEREGSETDRESWQVPEPLLELFAQIRKEKRDLKTRLHVRQEVWSVAMAPVYTDGTVTAAVAVLRDVTEESKLEKLRRDFVANVSHEIRTPLSMVQGYSEALLDDIVTSPEERKELVQVIYDESLRMGRLVKDLLDLSRMEAGHIELNRERIEVKPLVERVYRKFHGMAKDKNIRFEYDLADAELVLEAADSDRLEQVLTNLLDNAFRHTPEGKTVCIRADAVQHADHSRWVKIEIEDEGAGIPAEDIPYIFERFYKADKARKRAGSGGTGLGLAIVKNIIDAHGGQIQVKSALGQGTTFLIMLPVAEQL